MYIFTCIPACTRGDFFVLFLCLDWQHSIPPLLESMVNHTNTHMHECNRIDVHVSQTAANITESDNEITTEDGHPGHL